MVPRGHHGSQGDKYAEPSRLSVDAFRPPPDEAGTDILMKSNFLPGFGVEFGGLPAQEFWV